MTDYKKLLKQYETYNSGERTTSEYQKNQRQKQLLKHRMLLVDELVLEAKYLLLTKQQVETVKELVRIFNKDFKKLHRQASDETIILSFIFYQKKLEEPRIRLENYKICKKYRLTDTVFQLILCRVTEHYMKKYPLPIRQSFNSNHDLLIKMGFK